MAAASRIQYWYWCLGSQPAADRGLYRAIKQLRPEMIVEWGLASTPRTSRLVRSAQRYQSQPIRYAAVDPFESGRDGEAMSLKGVHRLLRELGATAQFFPGEPLSLVPLAANRLSGVDFLVVAPQYSRDSFAGLWGYWPRMLHDKSQVAIWDTTKSRYALHGRDEVLAWAESDRTASRRVA